MANGPSTYGSISGFVNPIWEMALMATRDQNVMAPLVRNYSDREGMALRHNSQYGSVTVNAIAENDDLTPQTFNPGTIATLTPAEYGDQVFITDQRRESDPFNVQADAARELGQGLAQAIDTNLISSFTSFTAGTIGTAGSLITWSYIFAMQTALRNQKAPMPYSCVLTPNMWYELGKAASLVTTRTNAPESLMEKINQNFYQGRVGGIDFFTSTYFSNTAGTDAYIGMFSRDALALDMRRAMRIEPERDASKRGYELNLSCVYAYGVWRPLFGVAGLFANDAVTGV